MTEQKKPLIQYVLKLLAQYPRTVREIKSKLAAKGYLETTIQEIIQEMIKILL